ncbi:hypothetical protein [Archangium violaceum]|uniref:Uncharacterized protein n=1 Tax=Archangium violaceum Cb vi76 TaxID=1406225 RepID=A0A084SPP0_9BACT|nr:hypothetical protein [Archangium violaceum]KFA90425.1 hypothetical protein Q664_28720 [Archangium violaceum Cb vi76]
MHQGTAPRALLVALALVLFVACEVTEPAPEESFRGTVRVGLECENGFHHEELVPAADGSPEVFFSENALGAYRTSDGGRSFSRIYTDDLLQMPGITNGPRDRTFKPRRVRPIDALRVVLFADSGGVKVADMVFGSRDGGRTFQRLVGGTREGGALPPDLARVSVDMRSPVAVHRLDDTTIIASVLHEGWFASTDNGVTWRAFDDGKELLTDTVTGNRTVFVPHVRQGARSLYLQLGPRGWWLAEGNAPLRKLCNEVHDEPRLPCGTRAALGPGGRIAYAGEDFLAVSEDDGATFVRAPLQAAPPSLLAFDAAGRVHLIRETNASPPGTARWVRAELVQGRLVFDVVEAQAGEVPLRDFVSVIPGPDGAHALLARVEKPSPGVRRHLLCRFSEGDGALAALTPGSPASFEPGRAYVYARRNDMSRRGDRFTLDAKGRAYVATHRQVWAAPDHEAPLFDITPGPLEGERISFLYGVSLLGGVLHVAEDDDGRKTGGLSDETVVHQLNPGTGAKSGEVRPRVPTGYTAHVPVGWGRYLSGTADMLVTSGHNGSVIVEAPLSRVGGATVLPPYGRFGHDGTYVFATTRVPVEGVTRIGRIDVARERVDLASCDTPGRRCWSYPGEVAALSTDHHGRLYVVDALRGQVLRRSFDAPDETPWTVVGEGFMHPTDLQVRDVGDATRVYVLDGDVFVFEADDARPARRGNEGAPVTLGFREGEATGAENLAQEASYLPDGVEVHSSCRTSRAGYCVLRGTFRPRLATSGASIGGLPARVLAENFTEVRLGWPEGLAPGAHEAVLPRVDPGSPPLRVQVTLLADERARLFDLRPERLGLPRHGQLGGVVGGETWVGALATQWTVQGDSTGLIPSPARLELKAVLDTPGLTPLGLGLRERWFDTRDYDAGTDVPRVHVSGEAAFVSLRALVQDPRTGNWSPPTSFTVRVLRAVRNVPDTGSPFEVVELPALVLADTAGLEGRIEGLTAVGGVPVVATYDTGARLFRVHALEGSTWREVWRSGSTGLTALAARDALYVYAQSASAPPSVARLGLSLDADAVQVALAGPYSLTGVLPRGIRLTGTAEGDGLFVAERTDGVHAVLRVGAGTDSVETLALVDPSLPGVGEVYTESPDLLPLPGLSAVTLFDGRPVLALARRTGDARTLRVAHWTGSGWALGDELLVGSSVSLCVGAVQTRREGEGCSLALYDGRATHGCGPLSCEVRSSTWTPRPGTLAERVALIPTSTGVDVLFESVFPKPYLSPRNNLGDHEVQLARVRLAP